MLVKKYFKIHSVRLKTLVQKNLIRKNHIQNLVQSLGAISVKNEDDTPSKWVFYFKGPIPDNFKEHSEHSHDDDFFVATRGGLTAAKNKGKFTNIPRCFDLAYMLQTLDLKLHYCVEPVSPMCDNLHIMDFYVTGDAEFIIVYPFWGDLSGYDGLKTNPTMIEISEHVFTATEKEFLF